MTSNKFIFDGNGSIFPIVTIEDSTNPLLWIVECSWDNPEEDAFTDSVAIKFNKAHKYYNNILFGNSKFDKQLFTEVIAAAMDIIISALRDNNPTIWANMMSSDYEAAEGSVSAIVKYFIDTISSLDFTNSNTTSITLRQYLQRKIKQ